MKLLVSIVTVAVITFMVASPAKSQVLAWTYYDQGASACYYVEGPYYEYTTHFRPAIDFGHAAPFRILKIATSANGIPAQTTVPLRISDIPPSFPATSALDTVVSQDVVFTEADWDTFYLAEPLIWNGAPVWIVFEYETMAMPFATTEDNGNDPKRNMVKMDWGWELTGCNFPIVLIVDLMTGIEGDRGVPVPRSFFLGQNFPNPFNPSTTISFELTKDGEVLLEVYNLRGQSVKKLASGNKEAGTYRVCWNGTDEQGMRVPSGLYLYRLETPEFATTKKMVLLK